MPDYNLLIDIGNTFLKWGLFRAAARGSARSMIACSSSAGDGPSAWELLKDFAKTDARAKHIFNDDAVLPLLGINHERLTFYHNGIRRRLTNVHGHVIREILA